MNNLVMSHAMPSSTSTDSAIPDTTSSAATLEWLVANDGHRIPLRHWPVASPRAVIHIVHGMAEHSGSYADTASAKYSIKSISYGNLNFLPHIKPHIKLQYFIGQYWTIPSVLSPINL